MKYPVYLVDDDPSVRDALTLLLSTVGIQVHAYPDPQQFLVALPRLAPGCLILDIRMPQISGLRLQDQLQSQACAWPVIIMSGHGDIEACRRAFQQGAVDYLAKPIDEQDLIDAIQKAQQALAHLLAQQAEQAERLALLQTLTPREHEVLARVAGGYTSRDIAQYLGVSTRTVESHRAALASKLGTSSPAEWTRIWLETQQTQNAG